MTNIETTINYIANEFSKIMKEEDFESFSEMSKCYWWTTNDIKEECRYYTSELELAYIDEVEGTLVIGEDGSEMSYREFISKIKKLANELLNA